MRSPTAVIVAAAGLLLAAPAFASPELHVDGQHFKDAQGRVVLLRGVNVAGDSKVPPFTPAKDATIFDPLQGWGMNAIRFLFNWEAYEPTLGAYDPTYLDYFATAAEAAWARGLYVIVDFHQDAFSRWSVSGCGEGFPKWAVPSTVPLSTPDNGPNCASWTTLMTADTRMKTSWTAFHADTGGVRTRYLAMIKSVAARLDANPGVIGYDLLNEPWGDEATELHALHEDAAVAVRAASPTAIVFISPDALISDGSQTALPPPTFGNAAYSPHYYAGTVVLFKNWSALDTPDSAFANMTGKAAQWGVPLLLGEFGAAATTVNGPAYMDSLFDALNAGLISGTQWAYTPGWTEANKDGWNVEDYSIVDGARNPRANFHPRPFPRKIAGVPTRLGVTHDPTPAKNVFELDWDNDPKAGATEIYLPQESFFGTTDTVIAAPSGTSCSFAGSLLTCTAKAAGALAVSVRVAPKAAPSTTPSRPVTPAASSHCGLVGAEMLVLWPLAWAARRRARRTAKMNVEHRLSGR